VSEDHRDRGKPIVDQALDLFFYAPVGLLVTSLEDLQPDDLEELAAKGRGRIGRVLSNARVVGHLTIAMGRRAIESEVRRWQPPPSVPPVTLHAGPAPEAPPADTAAVVRPRRSELNADLAIPGYEALSASQVIRRLDGLGAPELEAIYEYEATTRQRRTILHRIQQVQGREEPPGPASWPA